MGRLSIKTRIILFFRTISLKLDYAVKVERRIACLNQMIKCLEQYIVSSSDEYTELYRSYQNFRNNHTKLERKLINDMDRIVKTKDDSDFKFIRNEDDREHDKQ